MVTLIGPHFGKNLIDARETLQRSGVELNFVQETGEPHQPVGGILQRNAPHQAVNFIALGEQQFGKVGAILPRDPCDQGFALAHEVIQCSRERNTGTRGIQGTRNSRERAEPLGRHPNMPCSSCSWCSNVPQQSAAAKLRSVHKEPSAVKNVWGNLGSLLSGVKPAPSGSSMRGFVDRTEEGNVLGWAADLDNPDHAVVVEVRERGTPIASAVADLYRNDLELAGFGNGRHAFHCTLPPSYGGLPDITLTAQIQRTDFALPYQRRAQ